MSEQAVEQPLRDGEVELNGNLLISAVSERRAIEQITLGLIGALTATTTALLASVADKNLAICAGLVSVVMFWGFAILPNRRSWFNNEQSGFDTQQFLEKSGVRMKTKRFRDPATMSRFSIGVDIGHLGFFLFWIAQIPPIEKRLGPIYQTFFAYFAFF